MLSGLILDDGLVEEHCRKQDLKCIETNIDGTLIRDPPLHFVAIRRTYFIFCLCVSCVSTICIRHIDIMVTRLAKRPVE